MTNPLGMRNMTSTIMRKVVLLSVSIVALISGSCCLYASVNAANNSVIVPDIFSSGMVIQQQSPIRIWVEGNSEADVRVKLDGITKPATLLGSRWSVEFPPRASSTRPISMSIFAGTKLVREVKDILVGEVWLASGQSNMQMRLDMTVNGAKALERPADPLLRAFNVSNSLMRKTGPLGTVWESSANTTIGSWSGIGYYYSSQLRESLNVPVAIVHCSVGASFTETWCSPELLSNGYPEWDKYWKKNENNSKILLQNKPSLCYERLLKTVMPYTVRGVIWYQGEGNNERWAEQPRLFADMVSEWRAAWQNPELPFYFVQLAWYEPACWHEFRNAQRICWEQIPHTYMAVTADLSKEFEVPNPNNDPRMRFHPIHPVTKKPIGDRLAHAAEALVYGHKLGQEYSGPRIKDAVKRNDGIKLSFDFIGKGLVSSDAKELRGFSVAGSDNKYRR
jgi:sialate O-acetylesterase